METVAATTRTTVSSADSPVLGVGVLSTAPDRGLLELALLPEATLGDPGEGEEEARNTLSIHGANAALAMRRTSPRLAPAKPPSTGRVARLQESPARLVAE